MKTLNMTGWLLLSALLRGLEIESRFAALNPEHGKAFEAEAFTKTSIETLERIAEDCDRMGMTASSASLRKIVALQVGQFALPHTIAEIVKELSGRLLDEAQSVVVLSLEPAEAIRFTNPLSGWHAVIARFPEALGDVEEASKCFALSRYAASVFHSTQVVEFGVIALGAFVGVTDPKPGFTATTNKLEKLIATPYPDWAADLQPHSQSLKQIHERLRSLEDAWRNKISHASGKLTLLTVEFTPEVAEDILHATRAFMLRLVAELPKP